MPAARTLKYDEHRRAMAAKRAQETASGQEIDDPPAIVNRKRRDKAFADLERFLKLYFPWAFYMRWSADHLRAIARIERAIREGGLFALAMPRASGKTTIVERAALWAMLTGLRQFVCIIGATEKHCERILKNLMTELQGNDLL